MGLGSSARPTKMPNGAEKAEGVAVQRLLLRHNICLCNTVAQPTAPSFQLVSHFTSELPQLSIGATGTIQLEMMVERKMVHVSGWS